MSSPALFLSSSKVRRSLWLFTRGTIVLWMMTAGWSLCTLSFLIFFMKLYKLAILFPNSQYCLVSPSWAQFTALLPCNLPMISSSSWAFWFQCPPSNEYLRSSFPFERWAVLGGRAKRREWSLRKGSFLISEMDSSRSLRKRGYLKEQCFILPFQWNYSFLKPKANDFMLLFVIVCWILLAESMRLSKLLVSIHASSISSLPDGRLFI